MSLNGYRERSVRSAWVTREPSGSRRKSSPSPPETMSIRPSGSQSKQNGNEGALRIISVLPLAPTATISCLAQSEYQSLLLCQRGDSPVVAMVMIVCTLGTESGYGPVGRGVRKQRRDHDIPGFAGRHLMPDPGQQKQLCA